MTSPPSSSFLAGLLGTVSVEEALEKYGWALAAVAATAAVSLWSMEYYFDPQKRRPSSRSDQGPAAADATTTTTAATRSWSFTSHALALGSFPPRVEFREPIINSVMVFPSGAKAAGSGGSNGGLPTEDEMIPLVVKLLQGYDRFGQVYDPATGQSTSKHADLDPSDMIRVVEFGSSKDNANVDDSDAALMAVMEEHALDPLQQGLRGTVLPWWEFLILKNNQNHGKSAVVWRVHHALGDGISLVNVVQDLFLDSKGQKMANIVPKGMEKKFRIQRSPFQWVVDLLSAILTAVTVPVGPFDDDTLFYHRRPPAEMTFPKQFQIHAFEPIPFEFVKELKHAASEKTGTTMTINDVMFTALSQALHDYLKEHDDPALVQKKNALKCRALLPVAMPRPKTAALLRNLWCFVSVDLSVGVPNVLDRLQCIHETMSGMKRSLVPAVMIALQNYILVHFPLWFNRDQVLEIFSRHSMVASNVPGPPSACLFAGHEVESVQMIHVNLIPQLSLLSYRGMVFGNFTMGVDDDDNDGAGAGAADGEEDTSSSDETTCRRQREVLPAYLSQALVELAQQLNVEAPQSLQLHAAKLKS